MKDEPLRTFLRNVARGKYSDTDISEALTKLLERRCPACGHLAMYRTKSFKTGKKVWRCWWPGCRFEESIK